MPTHARTHLRLPIRKHVVSRHGISVRDERLFIRFEVRGPESSGRFIEDHVAAYGSDGVDKLDRLGGSGRDSADGTSYFVTEWTWSGEAEILLRYFDAGSALAEELVELPPVGADPEGALHNGSSFLSFRS